MRLNYLQRRDYQWTFLTYLTLVTCKNLDAHQPHTKEKMSHFEETLNKIEDGRWLPCYVCFSYIHLI